MTITATNANVFDNYKSIASVGAVATAICTLINPITGAAVGTYFVTEILANSAFDLMGVDHFGTLGKIAKAVGSFFVAGVATIGVLSLLGVTVTLTPTLLGFAIAVAAFDILLSLPSRENINL